MTDDQALVQSAELVKEKWGNFDILVHSIAFANRDDLKGRYVDTPRAGFHLAMDISAYSLVALCQAFEKMINDHGSIMAMTYYGSEKVIPNYNIMGVAKAALETSVRYLAMDLGERGIRVNAISAGPLKTLASSGISGFKTILSTIEERAPCAATSCRKTWARPDCSWPRTCPCPSPGKSSTWTPATTSWGSDPFPDIRRHQTPSREGVFFAFNPLSDSLFTTPPPDEDGFPPSRE